MELEFKSEDGSREIVKSKYYRILFYSSLVLLLNAGYLASLATSSYFYYGNLILHIALGVILIVPLLLRLRTFLNTDGKLGKAFGQTMGKIGYFLLLVCFASGLYLIVEGNSISQRYVLLLHAFAGFIAFGTIISAIRRTAYNVSIQNTYWKAGRGGLMFFVAATVMPLGSFGYYMLFTTFDDEIRNSKFPSASLAEAAPNGRDSHFYPSPAETSTGEPINTDFLRDSESCGRSGCHEGLVQQWRESSHSKDPVANEWYRSSISYVEKQVGAAATRYCAGCHAPARLFEKDKDASFLSLSNEKGKTPGIACTGCHSISKVNSTLGNAAYEIEPPLLFSFLSSTNPLLQNLHDFLVHIDPKPHAKTFSKPFMSSSESSEFCSTCHKQTLDKPLPIEFPVSGLQDYDYWMNNNYAIDNIETMNSPEDRKGCVDCHMPMVEKKMPDGSIKSFRDHSFSTTFAAGKQIDFSNYFAMNIMQREISRAGGKKDIAVDVVLKTKGIGHAFPAGNINGVKAWVELDVKNGDDVSVIENGAAIQEPFYYGTTFLDERGMMIEHAHGLGAKQATYYNFLPPGAPDVAPFKITLPENVTGSLFLTASFKMQERFVAGPEGTKVPDEVLLCSKTIEIHQKDFSSIAMTSGDDEKAEHILMNEYGIGLLRADRLAESKNIFQRAIRIKPDYLESYVNIGRAYLLEGKLDSALVHIKLVREISPENYDVRYLAALLFKNMGKYEEAKDILRDLRDQFPHNRAVINEYGHVYYLLKSYTAASRVFKRVIRFAPDDPVAHYYLMHVYEKLREPEKAAFEEKLYNRFSKRYNGTTIVPQLAKGDPVRSWQIVPWSYYNQRIPSR